MPLRRPRLPGLIAFVPLPAKSGPTTMLKARVSASTRCSSNYRGCRCHFEVLGANAGCGAFAECRVARVSRAWAAGPTNGHEWPRECHAVLRQMATATDGMHCMHAHTHMNVVTDHAFLSCAPFNAPQLASRTDTCRSNNRVLLSCAAMGGASQTNSGWPADQLVQSRDRPAASSARTLVGERRCLSPTCYRTQRVWQIIKAPVGPNNATRR